MVNCSAAAARSAERAPSECSSRSCWSGVSTATSEINAVFVADKSARTLVQAALSCSMSLFMGAPFKAKRFVEIPLCRDVGCPPFPPAADQARAAAHLEPLLSAKRPRFVRGGQCVLAVRGSRGFSIPAHGASLFGPGQFVCIENGGASP